MGGGYFPFFSENRPQKHKKHAILHPSQANGGGLEPPPPPPATLLEMCLQRKPVCTRIVALADFGLCVILGSRFQL